MIILKDCPSGKGRVYTSPHKLDSDICGKAALEEVLIFQLGLYF